MKRWRKHWKNRFVSPLPVPFNVLHAVPFSRFDLFLIEFTTSHSGSTISELSAAERLSLCAIVWRTQIHNAHG